MYVSCSLAFSDSRLDWGGYIYGTGPRLDSCRRCRRRINVVNVETRLLDPPLVLILTAEGGSPDPIHTHDLINDPRRLLCLNHHTIPLLRLFLVPESIVAYNSLVTCINTFARSSTLTDISSRWSRIADKLGRTTASAQHPAVSFGLQWMNMSVAERQLRTERSSHPTRLRVRGSPGFDHRIPRD